MPMEHIDDLGHIRNITTSHVLEHIDVVPILLHVNRILLHVLVHICHESLERDLGLLGRRGGGGGVGLAFRPRGLLEHQLVIERLNLKLSVALDATVVVKTDLIESAPVREVRHGDRKDRATHHEFLAHRRKLDHDAVSTLEDDGLTEENVISGVKELGVDDGSVFVVKFDAKLAVEAGMQRCGGPLSRHDDSLGEVAVVPARRLGCGGRALNVHRGAGCAVGIVADAGRVTTLQSRGCGARCAPDSEDVVRCAATQRMWRAMRRPTQSRWRRGAWHHRHPGRPRCAELPHSESIGTCP